MVNAALWEKGSLKVHLGILTYELISAHARGYRWKLRKTWPEGGCCSSMPSCGEPSGERVTYGPLTSAGITTAGEALAFYERYLAGDHDLLVGRECKRFLASFNPYEIHAFTEGLKSGEPCPQHLLVRRQDRGRREMRRLDVRRAPARAHPSEPRAIRLLHSVEDERGPACLRARGVEERAPVRGARARWPAGQRARRLLRPVGMAGLEGEVPRRRAAFPARSLPAVKKISPSELCEREGLSTMSRAPRKRCGCPTAFRSWHDRVRPRP